MESRPNAIPGRISISLKPNFGMYQITFFVMCSAAMLAAVIFVMIATKFKLSFVIMAGVSAVYLAYLLSHALTYQ